MYKNLFVWLLMAATVLLEPLYAKEIRVEGSVRCEGKGITGVWVTDGEHFAQTDRKGDFSMIADSERPFLYLTVPAGYEAPIQKGVVRHYQKMPQKDASHCDFELIRRTWDEKQHILIATADPQIWAQKEFPLLARGVADIRETIASTPERLHHGICLGDIVFNTSDFYPEYNALMAQTEIPFRHIIGNHDMGLYIRSHEGSPRLYGETYGPDYYSFDIGEVHYVVLNDNFYIGRDWYYIAYLEERQLKWLEEDLSHLKQGQTVILSMHIPSTCTPEDREAFDYSRIEGALVNYKGLYELLEPFNAHILSGHTHTTFNSPVRENLYDHVIPALSGAWWQGELCTDGTPAGYAVFEIDGQEVSWYYKSVGHPATHQMRLYSGEKYPEFDGYVVANIWNSDEAWKVTFLFDGTPTEIAPERFTAYDPAARECYASNERLDHKWIGPTRSDHFYRVPLPEGASRLEVRATDRFGRTYTETLELTE